MLGRHCSIEMLHVAFIQWMRFWIGVVDLFWCHTICGKDILRHVVSEGDVVSAQSPFQLPTVVDTVAITTGSLHKTISMKGQGNWEGNVLFIPFSINPMAELCFDIWVLVRSSTGGNKANNPKWKLRKLKVDFLLQNLSAISGRISGRLLWSVQRLRIHQDLKFASTICGMSSESQGFEMACSVPSCTIHR